MTPFCTDIDLLRWEPNLFAEAAFASQTLMSGTCDLAGTTLTISAGSFTDSHIEPDQIVVLTGAVAGSFPVKSVDSATALTVSILYDGLFADTPAASPVGSATGLSFVLRTFWPQRQVISEILQQAAGIIPGDPKFAAAQILNPLALRRACVLGTLQLIYSALSAIADAPTEYQVRAELYQRLYQREMRSTQVEIDLDNDGHAEITARLDNVELTRA